MNNILGSSVHCRERERAREGEEKRVRESKGERGRKREKKGEEGKERERGGRERKREGVKRRKGERGGEGEACKIQIQLYGKNAMTVSNNYYWF